MTHQPDIGGGAVLKAAGRSWRERLALLDAAHMAQSTHEEHGVPSWWRQSLGRVSPGEGRCEWTAGHRKLASASAVERMRAFWKQSIDRLVERVGSAR